MEQINIAELEKSVALFYQSSSQEQSVTHNWLVKAQYSKQAWQFCWEMMQLHKVQEVQFFGAITLHTKLTKNWYEVPEENREELRQKILETIIMFASGPKLVLNRLCISLSVYIAHMIDEWPTSIEEVIDTFQNRRLPNVSVEMQLWIMLEVLEAIPEEIEAIYSSIKRVVLRATIAKRTPLVFQTIQEFLKVQLKSEWSHETECYSNMSRAVMCIYTWVKNLGYPIEDCVHISATLLEIVNKCYWPCVRNPDNDGCMSADENDLAENCLKALGAIITQPDCHLQSKSVIILIKMLIDSLCDITKMEFKHDNNNEDIAVNIYTLFISAAERHSKLLASGIETTNPDLSELYGRMIEEILQCTDKPGVYPVEESCSNIAMGFWFMLQDEVFAMHDQGQKMRFLEFIKPLYARLTEILVRKAEQPNEDSLDKWSSDDLESFRCYRQDICDTFMYCFDVLHDLILDIFSAALDKGIADLQNNPRNWVKLEASIFAFQSVAEHFNGDEVKRIPKLIHVLAEIPYENLNEKLLGTALETAGSYCPWLKDNPTFIPPMIELLVRGLNSTMSAQATFGLKELCRDCQLQMKPYAEPLLNACHNALTSGRLKNSDNVRLMYPIGKLMSLLPGEQIPKYLDIIVGPCFEELHAICLAKQTTNISTARIRTTFRLNMISTLFASLNTELDDEPIDVHNVQPVLLVMQQTMPLFRQIAELWVEELDVLEVACSALKHAIINLKSSFKPMLQDLCHFIVAIFQTRCCAPTLEISKTAVVIFYRDADCTELMKQLLGEFVLHSYKLFDATPVDSFSNIAETIDMFYGCLTQIIKKLPDSLNDSVRAYDKLIFYALKAMSLPENGPIRSSIQFLSHFIMQSHNCTRMTEGVRISGENIVRTAIMCVGCTTPRQQVDKFADIFLSLNKKYPSELTVWLKSIVMTPNFPSPLINEADKQRFATLVIREKVNKRLLQQHLNDFALKSRGLVLN